MVAAILAFFRKLFGITEEHPAYLPHPTEEQMATLGAEAGVDPRIFQTPPNVGENR